MVCSTLLADSSYLPIPSSHRWLGSRGAPFALRVVNCMAYAFRRRRGVTRGRWMPACAGKTVGGWVAGDGVRFCERGVSDASSAGA